MSIELFLDTETSGMVNFGKSAGDPCQPLPIQIAAILSSKERIFAEVNFLVWDPSIKIDLGALEVHGIDEETCKDFGVSMDIASKFILQLYSRASRVISHNVKFDRLVICSMLTRVGLTKDSFDVFKKPSVCTMVSTTELLRLPSLSKRGGFKWPKLQELYKFLFNEEFEGAHDALADVKALRRCFYELVDRKELT